jgi:hypothetical protein
VINDYIQVKMFMKPRRKEEPSKGNVEGTPAAEEPAKLFVEPDPVPSSMLFSDLPSAQQGNIVQSNLQEQQRQLNRMDQARQQAELLRLAQLHQENQLRQQEDLLRQAHAHQGLGTPADTIMAQHIADLNKQVAQQQAINMKHIGSFRRLTQSAAGVQLGQPAVTQIQASRQAPVAQRQAPRPLAPKANQAAQPVKNSADPLDQVIKDVFQFLQVLYNAGSSFLSWINRMGHYSGQMPTD